MVTLTEVPVVRRLTWPRRILGVLSVALMVAVIVLFAFGAGSSNVFLRGYFGDPVLGAFLALALSILSSMLLVPVRDEASQYRRSRFRTVQVIVTFLALIAFGFVWGLGVFEYSPTVIAHSADGTRSAATIDKGPSKELHVLVGKGLSARDVGDVGLACGASIRAKFANDSLMTVDTEFGTYQINLDPTTGAPLDHLPATCGG